MPRSLCKQFAIPFLPLSRFILLIVLFQWWLLPAIAAAQDTPSAVETFKEAKELFYDTDYDESEALFRSVRDELCDNSHYQECIETLTYLGIFKRYDRALDEGEELLLSAVDLADEVLDKDDPRIVKLYAQTAYIYVSRSEIENSDKWASRAVERADRFDVTGTDKSFAYLSRGYVDDLKGNYRSAVENYKVALDEANRMDRTGEVVRVLTMGYNNLGISYRRLGQSDDAMRNYQKNAELVAEYYGENHSEMAIVYNSFGSILYGRGDYATAADYFEQSAGVLVQVHGEMHNLVAGAFNNAGLSYVQLGDLPRATEMLERAQTIKEELLGMDHLETAIGFNNLASIYVQYGEYDRAEENYIRSIEVRKNMHDESHPTLVDPKVQLARMYMQTDRMDEARTVLSRAEEIALTRLGEEHPDLIEIHNLQGDTYLEEGRLSDAMMYYERTLSRLIGTTYDADQMNIREGALGGRTTIDIEDIDYPLRLIETVKRVTTALDLLYVEEDKEELLVESLDLYDLASRTIDHLQTQYQSEASKLNLVDQNYEIYAGAMDVIYELYTRSGDAMWSNLFYEYSETSRARVALELLQDLEAREFAGVPDEILQTERDLNSEVARYLQRLNLELEKGVEGDSETAGLYRDSLFRAKRNLREFTETLERQYPEYHDLKYQREILPLRDLQAFIDEDETVLSYSMGLNDLYISVITRDSFSVINLGEHNNLDGQIETLRASTLNGETDRYREYAHDLYNKLIDPVYDRLAGETITVLPDQALHYLPFELLLTSAGNGSEPYHRMPFLIRDHKVQYSSSATILRSTQQRRPSEPRNLFAVAPFNESGFDVEEESGLSRYVERFTPLPISNVEAREISDLFRQRRTFRDFFFPHRTEVLTDRRATKARVLDTPLHEFSYIHFATHAFVNEENPALSGIALHTGSGDDDGVIYLNDIYNLQMDADLVVLSACDTGLGSLQRGEGLIGFSRAFYYAGASNLVVSMWRVSDQPTSRLMISFYNQIMEGKTYGESIREAKMELISNPETAAPRYWAAFILNGR